MFFSLYGLEFDVPKEYKIQIYKGSLFFEGTVEFMDFQGNTIKVDWNEIDKTLGKDRSIKEFFTDYFNKIKAERTLSKFDLKEFPHEGLSGHEYYFYKLSYTTFRRFPHKEIVDYLIGLGVVCHNNNRVIIIQYRPPEGQAGLEDIVMGIIRSFRCRCAEST
jgi:hypothetical protein